VNPLARWPEGGGERSEVGPEGRSKSERASFKGDPLKPPLYEEPRGDGRPMLPPEVREHKRPSIP
jgi:hypothetical protein